MSHSPAFQFYPDDFMGGKPGMMTPDETHVFVWLLCLDWNQNGFQYDARKLAHWCRVPLKTFERAWPVVSECFTELDGRLSNPRLQLEREKQANRRAQMTENGKKGGRPKKASGFDEDGSENQSSGTKSLAKANQNESSPSPSPTPVNTKGREKSAPWMSDIRKVWIDRFNAEPPKGLATSLRSVVNTHGIETVVSHLNVYLDKTEPQFHNLAKFASTFASWAPGGSSGTTFSNHHEEAERIWAICKRSGIHHATKDTIDAELVSLRDSGEIDDTETFRAVLRRLDLRFLRAAQSDRAAVTSIVERLAA